jgi:hypothetical protein
MTDFRAESLLTAAADLEARDAAIAGEHARAHALLADVDRIRARSDELRRFLDGVPSERAALDAAEADARDEQGRASATLVDAERRVAELEAKRRPSADDLAQARREHDRAVEAVVDAEARMSRLVRARSELGDAELASRAEAEGLAVEARAVAGELRDLPRLSESGRTEPGESLVELFEWGGRTHAALFVVRGSLDAERERVVREAAELGASVVGEPLHGATVSAMRQRIEQTLRTA